MRWKGRRESENVEDRRSMGSGRPMIAGGGIFGLILILLFLWLGGDPRLLMNAGPPGGGAANPPARQGGPVEADPHEQEMAQMVAVVLGDTETIWGEIFRRRGNQYREPTLVIFRDSVRSACGFQGAATGPFYCPRDEKVYIDLSFFDEMETRLRAGGDFAYAYVIAHEVGHHVQKLMGISDQIHQAQVRGSKEQANALSVRLELHADFLAGVWAHHAEEKYRLLERGDIEEAMQAANAIGDDRLQREAQGYVVPESFTHGTSEQRTRWFLRGLKSGDLDDGDTFSIPYNQL